MYGIFNKLPLIGEGRLLEEGVYLIFSLPRGRLLEGGVETKKGVYKRIYGILNTQARFPPSAN